jgi:hypothetical protein
MFGSLIIYVTCTYKRRVAALMILESYIKVSYTLLLIVRTRNNLKPAEMGITLPDTSCADQTLFRHQAAL